MECCIDIFKVQASGRVYCIKGQEPGFKGPICLIEHSHFVMEILKYFKKNIVKVHCLFSFKPLGKRSKKMICNHSSLIAVTLAYRCRLKFQYYQMANHNFDLVKLQFVCTLLTDISHREEQRCLKLRSIIFKCTTLWCWFVQKSDTL